MWALICYAFVLVSEGVTAWIYFEQVFKRKSKLRILLVSFLIGYFALFVISQIEDVLINLLSFFVINCVLLFLNFTCKKWIGFLQIGYLTSVMGGLRF